MSAATASPTTMMIASEAWSGGELPDWVAALAAETEKLGEKAVAKVVGYSPSVIYEVIRCRYGGSYSRVEASVRQTIMRVVVKCPIAGEITGGACTEHQRRPYSSSNPTRVALYRACRNGCPHSSLKGDSR